MVVVIDDNMDERNLEIYYERLQGATYASLAEKYSLSKSVVSRICNKESKLLSLACSPVYSALITVNADDNQNIRIYNALNRAGIDTREELIRHSLKFYRSLRGIGENAVAVIQRAIEYCKSEA